ncbi:Hypothetical predicted protein [Paramuricea clavata]|uniref:Uncharacterized protein n=1 Tax=Paramuricea clavata TaxID=317549 RepID=A0A6S7JM15_PARCT|nr:Hypothetical predicted protein [Paramuricea clavata]
MEEAKRLLDILLARRAAAKKATTVKSQEERTSLESESELSDGSEVDDEITEPGDDDFGLELADGQLDHVCFTRDWSSGHFKVYKNGVLGKTMAVVKNEQEIEAGGTWVIGQDQDSLGGGLKPEIPIRVT